MRKKLFLSIILIVLAIPLFSEGKKEDQPENQKVSVAVSILPQKFFVEQIGGNAVKVQVLVLPGESPATYEPTPKQVTALSKARILFTIGVPFEKAFIPKIRANLKDLSIVDTSAGIKKRTFSNGSTDPHIWMAPPLVKIQARTILESLIRIDPGEKEFFTKNYNRFMEDLDTLNREIARALAPLKGSILFVYHPSFGYFADQYGLKQVAIETGGKDPGPKTLSTIIKKVKASGAHVIFVQPEFRQNSARVIAQNTGAAVTAIDPLAENYLSNMRKIEKVLAGALE